MRVSDSEVASKEKKEWQKVQIFHTVLTWVSKMSTKWVELIYLQRLNNKVSLILRLFSNPCYFPSKFQVDMIEGTRAARLCYSYIGNKMAIIQCFKYFFFSYENICIQLSDSHLNILTLNIKLFDSTIWVEHKMKTRPKFIASEVRQRSCLVLFWISVTWWNWRMEMRGSRVRVRKTNLST